MKDAPQTSNSANGSNSTSIASPGDRSHAALTLRAYDEVSKRMKFGSIAALAYVVLELRVSTLLNQSVGEAQRAAELLVLVCEVHGGEEGECDVAGVHARYCEVGRQLKDAFPLVFRQSR